jgi:hypothetical protein
MRCSRRGKPGAVLARGMCSVYPFDGSSVEELVEGGLKSEIGGVVEYCIDDYSHRILGL